MVTKKKSAKTKKPAKKRTKKQTTKETSKKVVNRSAKTVAAAKPAGADVPSLFRLNVEVGDLDRAAEFYGKLFGLEGRKQAGSRCYFNCGGVTLQVVDVSSMGTPHPAAKALYFLVNDLDAVFERAKALDCLSKENVHGVAGGAISVRPWGERSFYAEDRWQNPLCFVEAGTVYPG